MPDADHPDKYDYENRLITRSQTGLSVQMVYDADGVRVEKVNTGSGTTNTWYIVDQMNPTGFEQVLEEWQSINGAPATRTRTHIYGMDLISQRDAAGTTHYYGYDGQGSVRFLTDGTLDANGNPGPHSGDITDTFTYDAFGILVQWNHRDASWALVEKPVADYSQLKDVNVNLYAGEQWDPDLGLYYNRARYYNPDTGRFWTMDTWEGDQSDPLSLHKYLYCQGNPLNRIDPSGRMSYSEVMSAVTIGVAINSFLTVAIAGSGFKDLDIKDPHTAFVVSLRGTAAGRGLIGEGGVDILWIRGRGLYFYVAGDFGSAPLSFWKIGTGRGVSVTFGVAINIKDPDQWKGFGCTTTIPFSAALWEMRMIPPGIGVGAKGGLMGWLEKLSYVQRRKPTGTTIQVGFNADGVSFAKVGLWTANTWAWEVNLASKPVSGKEVGDAIRELAGIDINIITSKLNDAALDELIQTPERTFDHISEVQSLFH